MCRIAQASLSNYVGGKLEPVVFPLALCHQIELYEQNTNEGAFAIYSFSDRPHVLGICTFI